MARRLADGVAGEQGRVRSGAGADLRRFQPGPRLILTLLENAGHLRNSLFPGNLWPSWVEPKIVSRLVRRFTK